MNSPDFSSVDIRDLFRPWAGAIRAVMEVEEGSGGRRAIGSATVISNERSRHVVTAAHTVSGPQTKLLGVDGQDALPWPRRYSKLSARTTGLPDPDLAWATATVEKNDTSLAQSFPLALSLGGVPDYSGSVYLAAGFPASKAKMRYSQSVLASSMMVAVVEIAPQSTWDALSLDKRVHIAFSYSQRGREDLQGNATVGAQPTGMSGGAVFAMLRGAMSDGSSVDLPYLIGILTDFHPKQQSFVAIRISHLWRAIGALQDGQQICYDRVDVR